MDDLDPAVRQLCGELLPDAEQHALGMAGHIRTEVAFYREDQVPPQDLLASCTDNLRYVLGRLAGGVEVSPEAPRATGEVRAEQGVPYDAVLQAFRVGGRYIWELLVDHADEDVRDVLVRAAADIWAVSDDLAAVVTDAYRATLVERARRDGQRRSVLVGALLDGDLTAAEQLRESALTLDLPRNGEFVVVSAECPTTGAEGLPDVEQVLRSRNVASAWRMRREHQDGLVALRLGYDVPHLVEDLARLAVGRVGVSQVFRRVDGAPEARREALIASLAATPRSRELVRFEDRPLAVLLAGSPEGARALAARVLGPVLELPPADRDSLLVTARTWLAEAGSTSTAAKQLHLHRNSVRYRLQRLQELTGRDLAEPVAAAEVHVALECVRILGLD